MTPWRTVIHLAIADLLGEKTLAACSMLGLAAVLAPLIVLAGLRQGVVAGLRELLLENPHAREIVTVANRTLPAADLAGIAQWPGVQLLVPRTRTLSSSMVLQNGEDGPSVRIELVPTAPGDPLLPEPVGADDELVLSAAAAARLRIAPGATLTGRIGRTVEGRRESETVPLRVRAVAPPAAFSREAAFVTVPLAVLVEDYQEGASSWTLGTQARPRDDYAGFRLYAARLEDVPALDSRLRAAGIEVSSRANEVASIGSVDRSLGTLFSVVAGLGGMGFLVSLGAGLWANVERKRVPLALLRFLGLRRLALWLVPLLQALLISGIGATVGLAAAWTSATGINRALAGLLAINRPICVISAPIAAAAYALTLGGALLVATLASTRAARIEPWEGVSTP